MSDNDNNNITGGRSLEGGAAEPLAASWARPAQAPRVGRIGDWSGYVDGSIVTKVNCCTILLRNNGNNGRSGSRFGTISGLQASRPDFGGFGGQHGRGDDDDDSDEDGPDRGESWFAGGERR